MSRDRSRKILLGIGCMVFISISILISYFVLFKVFNSTVQEEPPNLSSISVKESVATEPEMSNHLHELDQMSNNGLSSIDVWNICPVDQWPDAYDEETASKILNTGMCREVFDQYIRTKSLTAFNILKFVSIDETLTFGRIFADPMGDRDRVFDTLSRSDCLEVVDGEVRWDLKETCHAEALTNFVYFSNLCGNKDTPVLRFKGSVSNIGNPDHQFFIEESGSKWKNWLARDWVVQQCTQFDVKNVILDEVRDAEAHAMLNSLYTRTLRNIEPLHPRLINQHTPNWDLISDVIVSIAARLGDNWATINYPRSLFDESWGSVLDEHYPWLDSCYSMFYPFSPLFSNREIQLTEATKPEQYARVKMRNSLLFVFDLEASGIDVKWKVLMEFLCPKNSDCNTMIGELKDEYKHDFQRLRVLDQFEYHFSDLNRLKLLHKLK